MTLSDPTPYDDRDHDDEPECPDCGNRVCLGCTSSAAVGSGRDELIEAMARASWAACPSAKHATYDEAMAGSKGWMLQEIAEDEAPRASAMLTVAVEAVLSRIEALHQPKPTKERLPNGVTIPWKACACGFRTHSACPTAREIAAIRAEWGQR